MSIFRNWLWVWFELHVSLGPQSYSQRQHHSPYHAFDWNLGSPQHPLRAVGYPTYQLLDWHRCTNCCSHQTRWRGEKILYPFLSVVPLERNRGRNDNGFSSWALRSCRPKDPWFFLISFCADSEPGPYLMLRAAAVARQVFLRKTSNCRGDKVRVKEEDQRQIM